MSRPIELFEQLRASGQLVLPMPGAGRTAERHRRLVEIGRRDVAVARLAEAHTDALAILHEAGRAPRPDARYGVWAAEDPTAGLRLAAPTPHDAGHLSGSKAFCTGAGLVTRALITVPGPGGVTLLDVDLGDAARITVDTSSWVTSAFAGTKTGVVTFDQVPIDTDDVIGGDGWYLDRPGFWHGACGPAACWAGGAIGLIDWAVDVSASRPAEPHRDAHLGALSALRWQMLAVLDTAGDQIDLEPTDAETALQRALIVRHLIERAATEVIDRIGRATGPRPFAFDAEISRRLAEVQLYIRQCHAERDLDTLGRAIREHAPPP